MRPVTPPERPIVRETRFGLRAAHPAVLIATGFGVGLIPLAPGTWASLVAVAIGALLRACWGLPGLGFAGFVAFAAGCWAAGAVVKASGLSDPGEIVIDELAGQILVLLAAPRSLAGSALAFVTFRIFDITKPWPVGWADRHVGGGFGIMLDDLLAAGYALTSLWLARKLGSVLG